MLKIWNLNKVSIPSSLSWHIFQLILI
jgi:hypothetical protein